MPFLEQGAYNCSQRLDTAVLLTLPFVSARGKCHFRANRDGLQVGVSDSWITGVWISCIVTPVAFSSIQMASVKGSYE